MVSAQDPTAGLASIFVGLPKTLGDPNAKNPIDREWTSAIFKKPVDGPIYVGKTNLIGDQQADLKHHGGPEKAIFSYPSEHYPYWQAKLNNTTIQEGGMGENFSTIHLLEKDVAIGDIFEIGNAIIQISQPRQPCWKPARRYRTKELAMLLQNAGRTGWYYRVLQEGFIEVGQSFKRIERPSPEWTVERCNTLMHCNRQDFKQISQLVTLPTLASNWKATFQKRLDTGKIEQIERRVYGPNISE